jgi:hypothetical protein
MVNLHKSGMKDQIKKCTELYDWQLSLTGVKLLEIKSLEAITSVIKRN